MSEQKLKALQMSVDGIKKQIELLQDTIKLQQEKIETLSNLLVIRDKQISETDVRISRVDTKIDEIRASYCALKFVQGGLFRSLEDINPLVYSSIVDAFVGIASESPKSIYGKAVIDYLRELTGIEADPRPLLRLVPKRDPSSSSADDQQ